MSQGNLGKKIYKSVYSISLEGKNDGNGHLNHSWYDNNSESVRQKFLRRFDWIDSNFPVPGVMMFMKEAHQDFRRSSYSGDKMEVRLEIFSAGRIIYNMVYNFIDPESGEVVCIDTTKCCFVDKDERPIRVPDFFLDALRSVEKD